MGFADYDYKNLSLLGFFLLCLWTILGLIFWGKLNIALTIRQKNYFSVGTRWNGRFEKNRGELRSPLVGDLFTPPISTGYPDIPSGCPFLEHDGSILDVNNDGFATCADSDKHQHWVVPKWVKEVKFNEGCEGVGVFETKYSPDCILDGNCDFKKVCMFAVPAGSYDDLVTRL